MSHMEEFKNKIDADMLLKKIENCQAGNSQERNQLIKDYMPFIIKTSAEHLHRYIQVENCDEVTIAMMAFDEAITNYQAEKGAFIHFAKRLIVNRLIDFQRLGNKPAVLSYDDPNNHLNHDLFSSENIEKTLGNKTNLETYESILKVFGLTYDVLIEKSPKHSDTRLRGMKIGKESSQKPPIVDKLYASKRLPITLISTTFKVTLKIIKGSKAFITSVIIAYVERVDIITEWIDEALKE